MWMVEGKLWKTEDELKNKKRLLGDGKEENEAEKRRKEERKERKQ